MINGKMRKCNPIILPLSFYHSFIICRKHLYPVIIRIMDEVQSHSCIFKAYPTHFFMVLVNSFIITGNTEA